MPVEVGSIVIKLRGREASRYAVVVKKIDENFVLITGPKALTGVKRRRCNIMHLEDTGLKLNIKEDASDEEVLNAWKESGLYRKFHLKLPPAYALKEAKKEVKEEKKEEKSKEKERKEKKQEKAEEKKKETKEKKEAQEKKT